jgi:hypothetical protein
VFYPGGHGPLWDLANDTDSIKLIEAFAAQGKPVAAVCHAPGAFINVKTADGAPFVKGKKVTGFSNTEVCCEIHRSCTDLCHTQPLAQLCSNHTRARTHTHTHTHTHARARARPIVLHPFADL